MFILYLKYYKLYKVYGTFSWGTGTLCVYALPHITQAHGTISCIDISYVEAKHLATINK